MTVGVLVLAAGRARRFGADKRQALLPDGRRVIDTTLCNISASGLPFLVCVAADDDVLIRHLTAQAIACQRCMRAGEGIGATLAEGIGHAEHWRGALVALADMPWIAPETYSRIAKQLGDERIVVPVYNRQRGHPVGFAHAFYPQLRALHGDVGARSVVTNHAAQVTEVVVSDAAILRDIDLPEDLPNGS
jgi:molybdenum cofactor cytidylyltransferase